jgi:hypothetical protein
MQHVESQHVESATAQRYSISAGITEPGAILTILMGRSDIMAQKTAKKSVKTGPRKAPRRAVKKTAGKAAKTTAKKTAGKTAKKTAKKASKATKHPKLWSNKVTETSDAMTLEDGVFKKTPRAIALSIKRSAERSDRRKSTPFRSAMSMLTFYENRAGKNLSASRKSKIDKAKDELRDLYGKH